MKSYKELMINNGKLMDDLNAERIINNELKIKLNIAIMALKELGYYGTDFGYGPFYCNVAETAQTALRTINEK